MRLRRTRRGVTISGLIPALVAALVSGAVLYLVADNIPRATSHEDAVGLLRRYEALARARDARALCERGVSVTICRRMIEASGGVAAMPVEPARVVESYATPRTPHAPAGRVLVVEGRDGAGKPYRTSLWVFRAGLRGPTSFDPVYWSGVSTLPMPPGGASTDKAPDQ